MKKHKIPTLEQIESVSYSLLFGKDRSTHLAWMVTSVLFFIFTLGLAVLVLIKMGATQKTIKLFEITFLN